MTTTAKFKKRDRTDHIVIHCSATTDKQNFTAADIDRMHRSQGWAAIGYHYVIRRDGTLEKGRDESVIGAHVSGHNSNTVAVCMVGGVDHKTRKNVKNFTPEQWGTLLEIVTELQKKYPKATVKGHRDFPNVKKDCPCFDAGEWWAKIQHLKKADPWLPGPTHD